MRAFAELLDRLVLTPQRNGKLRLLVDYFRTTPDPDRGLALAAITRDLELQSVKPAMLRALIAERTDPTLFAYSYDYVGDLAETISLIWPGPSETAPGQICRLVSSCTNCKMLHAAKAPCSWQDGSICSVFLNVMHC